MASNNHKTIISICPFQTQLTVSLPTTKEHLATRAVPVPQILKVACDREKCQLWDSTLNVCSVSVPLRLCTAIKDVGDDCAGVLLDIVYSLQDIKEHMATGLPSR